jgi:2-iminoacetate synthase ThiH
MDEKTGAQIYVEIMDVIQKYESKVTTGLILGILETAKFEIAHDFMHRVQDSMRVGNDLKVDNTKE